ncbi:hypothetical protein [Gordonia sp. NPDC058843]|uniref:hypothetical protein n=1 Tax=Gordonia sp. NPDC058843 TaxID=3346648 RepID=UPI00368EB138
MVEYAQPAVDIFRYPYAEELGVDESPDRQQAARRFRWWEGVVAVLIVVVGVGAGLAGLRWALFEWIDRSMLPHTYESVDSATGMAERMGLILVDGDDVVYGEVTSAFPDSNAYLVVVTPSADRLAQLLDRSGFPPPTSVTPDSFGVGSHKGHGPAPSATLVRSEQWRSTNFLTAIWDPIRDPRRVYISATQT